GDGTTAAKPTGNHAGPPETTNPATAPPKPTTAITHKIISAMPTYCARDRGEMTFHCLDTRNITNPPINVQMPTTRYAATISAGRCHPSKNVATPTVAEKIAPNNATVERQRGAT